MVVYMDACLRGLETCDHEYCLHLWEVCKILPEEMVCVCMHCVTTGNSHVRRSMYGSMWHFNSGQCKCMTGNIYLDDCCVESQSESWPDYQLYQSQLLTLFSRY